MGYCKWVHSESGYGWDFDGLVVVKGKREKIEMGFGLEGVFGGLGEGEQEVVANWNGEKGHCFLSPSDEVQIYLVLRSLLELLGSAAVISLSSAPQLLPLRVLRLRRFFELCSAVSSSFKAPSFLRALLHSRCLFEL
ncbi:hypothetical protein RHGRI_030670 [Rhododendron griersonianum]|uniref:Uncharacterized protein n=1 Tax=Rhododendron griersonianum TaxID=479676 RepID=A0AAV6I7L1_9ERIC|nr:hypothetical protein RHGRI_030670 [Rhododendron griersonianum]